MTFTLTARERRCLAWFVVAVAVIRLATLPAYPLMDTTESRYAEIARKMLETGDWLVPQFDYGVPFWGKPPLSTWLSAASMAVFGANEFAVRLPSLLLMAGCAALVYALAALRGGRDQALWTLALFAATAMVFIAAGGVMTDPALVLGTTLSMAGFWIAVHGAEKGRGVAGCAFFAGLAVGLLAKGPVAVILVFAPIGATILWMRSWRAAWRHLPWILGLTATAVFTGAWYWAAERASPGFLEYFLVGEHWKRFVEPGWKGDLYGTAHSRIRGMIWLFWVAAALPWSVAAIAGLARAATWSRDARRALAADPWRVYLLLWTIAPMAFFTPAGNILITYVLPGLPAFALLVGDRLRPDDGARGATPDPGALRPAVRRALYAGAVVPALFVAAIVALHGQLETERSQKALVRDYLEGRPGAGSRLVYFPQRPHSAEFYSRGKAQRAPDREALHAYLDDSTPDYFAIRDSDFKALPGADRERLEAIGAYGEYRLLRGTPR
ncbi:MAG: glycosyltransferase family 39 protein [Betaproteobacteria bacterium]